MRALRKGQAAIFNLTGDVCGEARIVERAFGVGPSALTEFSPEPQCLLIRHGGPRFDDDFRHIIEIFFSQGHFPAAQSSKYLKGLDKLVPTHFEGIIG